jgi:hypothetical protein
MSANKKLAGAVVSALFRKLGEKMPMNYVGVDEENGGEIYEPIYDEDRVEAVIREYQSKYPGSWQEWKHEEMLEVMTKLMLKAIRLQETAPARIVDL